MEGMDVGVESRIRISAAIVKIQHFFQTLEAAVVHVGGCQFDIAQCRSFKLSFILVSAVFSPASSSALRQRLLSRRAQVATITSFFRDRGLFDSSRRTFEAQNGSCWEAEIE